jgi:5-methylcytosine-specific restriction endonuclease McrA
MSACPAYFSAIRDLELAGRPLGLYLRLYHDHLDAWEYRPVKQLALAAEMQCSEDTIERCMVLLYRRGYLEREARRFSAPCRYRLAHALRAPRDTAADIAAERAHLEALEAMRRASGATKRARRRSAPGSGITRNHWAEIMADSLGICAYCGERRPLSLDHVDPLVRGGSHDPENAVAACKPCNSSKGATPLVLWLARGASKRATSPIG